MPRILIIDDDPDLLAVCSVGLTALGHEVSAAGTGDEGLSEAAVRKPDVIVLDIRMPELDGIEVTRRLQLAGSRARILILTTFDLNEYVYEAMRAGASGFLLKDAPGGELVNAVRVVASGDALLAPSITKRLIAEFAARREQPLTRPQTLDELTARELEVLRLIARGMSNAEISQELFITEQTTKTHVGRILMKLHLRDRVQAVVLAYESGLIAPGD